MVERVSGARRRHARRRLPCLVRNEHDSDDALQEAFSSVMKSGLPDSIDNLQAYLCEVTRNKARDITRRNKRLVLTAEDERVLPPTPGPPIFIRALSISQLTGSTPIALLECRQYMNDKQRYALEQRLMLGRPATEVAAELGVEPQRVSQLVSEAVRIIRKKQSFVDDRYDDIPLQQLAASGTEGEQ